MLLSKTQLFGWLIAAVGGRGGFQATIEGLFLTPHLAIRGAGYRGHVCGGSMVAPCQFLL